MIHKASPMFFVLCLCLFSKTISATDELMPDIDLLEFLGTIAGLEGMGVEIDLLLEGSLDQKARVINDRRAGNGDRDRSFTERSIRSERQNYE